MLLSGVEAELFNLLIAALIAVVTHQNSSDILVNLDMMNRTPVLESATSVALASCALCEGKHCGSSLWAFHSAHCFGNRS